MRDGNEVSLPSLFSADDGAVNDLFAMRTWGDLHDSTSFVDFVTLWVCALHIVWFDFE